MTFAHPLGLPEPLSLREHLSRCFIRDLLQQTVKVPIKSGILFRILSCSGPLLTQILFRTVTSLRPVLTQIPIPCAHPAQLCLPSKGCPLFYTPSQLTWVIYSSQTPHLWLWFSKRFLGPLFFFFFFPVRGGRQNLLVKNLHEPPSPRGSWMPPSSPRDEGTSKLCPVMLHGGDKPTSVPLSPTSHLHPDMAALQAPKHWWKCGDLLLALGNISSWQNNGRISCICTQKK